MPRIVFFLMLFGVFSFACLAQGFDWMPPPPAGSYGGGGKIPPALELFNEATELLNAGEYSKAVSKYMEALDISEDLPDKDKSKIFNNLAYAYLGIDYKYDALDAAEKAVDYSKRDVASVDTLGDVFQALGRHESMCDAFEEACNSGAEISCTKKNKYCD